MDGFYPEVPLDLTDQLCKLRLARASTTLFFLILSSVTGEKAECPASHLNKMVGMAAGTGSC